jgi:peptide/nickel transport system substrate-binding protein
MKKSRTMLSLLLALTMLVSVVPAFAGTTETPLVVAYDAFSEKFSPFFGETAYDMDVANMTQISLMTTDRLGGIVYKAIEGETIPYNGKDYVYKGAADLTVKYDEAADVTTYTAKLREDLKFSDGEPVTADDVIFSYYALIDPSYTGPSSLSSYPIIGLKDYRTQTTTAVYDKYSVMVDAIYAAGKDHVWAEGDTWTKEMQDGFWASHDANWKADVQAIVNTVNSKYASYGPDTMGYTSDEIAASEGLKVAFGMAMWGYGTLDPAAEEKVLTAPSGKTFNLTKGEFPTLDDYYAETLTAYTGDIAAYAGVESPDGVDLLQITKDAFIGLWGPKDVSMGGKGVPNVSGIKKLDKYTVEVKTAGYEAPAVYSILGIQVAPLHYYGDKAQYNYEKNNFGFPFGDLSKAAEKTSHPLGAGAYKFIKYENRVVYFEANEFYYKGASKTKYIQFKETNTSEVATSLSTGVADAGEMSGNKSNFETVAGLNSNGKVTGDVITTSMVDNLGYGYIGMNAATINVGGEPASVASKALRKAFGTVFAVYRAMAYDSYYGEAASVINYPISNTSWAAPQPTDPGYKVAFSVGVDGKDIYTSEMTPEQRYEAALQAAKGYFLAAGFTFDEATSVFTAAPEGAKLSYEIIIPGDGKGDHPSFAVLTATKALLARIGITLNINDPADSNVLWDALNSGLQEMWTAAWGATIDPDMYQVYHSNNIVGKGGTDSNHYHIADPELDRLILEARQSDDQAFRKAVYKQALDLIVDWAVEVPAYQRQNSVIFSTKRIKMETVTPDITTFYGWMSEIETLEMN